MFGNKLTVEEGWGIHDSQVQYYREMLESNAQGRTYEKQLEALSVFDTEIKKLKDGVVNPRTGYDIPRGVDIEYVYFKAIGKTDKEYTTYLSSLD
jgi:hypothetical protein